MRKFLRNLLAKRALPVDPFGEPPRDETVDQSNRAAVVAASAASVSKLTVYL